MDKTDTAMEKCHSLSQEIHDKNPMLEKMGVEVKQNTGDNSEELNIQFQVKGDVNKKKKNLAS